MEKLCQSITKSLIVVLAQLPTFVSSCAKFKDFTAQTSHALSILAEAERIRLVDVQLLDTHCKRDDLRGYDSNYLRGLRWELLCVKCGS